MRIAVLQGRGLEGCGVTKNSVELQSWADKAGHECKTFVSRDKRWGRQKSQVLRYSETKLASGVEVSSLVMILNTYDLVIVQSIPSTSHTVEAQQGFLDLLRRVTVPKGFLQCDHNKASIIRNANLLESIDLCDIVFSFSKTSPFSQIIASERPNIEVQLWTNGFDFDAHREKYWKPIEKVESHQITWIGRATSFKGPHWTCQLHDKHLAETYTTIMLGVERSMGFIGMKKAMGENFLELNKKQFQTQEEIEAQLVEGKCHVFGSYTHSVGMEILSNSGFAFIPTKLRKGDMYGSVVEHAMSEAIAVGAVPIFSKHFMENAVHCRKGTPFMNDLIDAGVLHWDPEEEEDLKVVLHHLARSPEYRDEMREKAFKYWKDHHDVSVIFPKLIEKILGSKK